MGSHNRGQGKELRVDRLLLHLERNQLGEFGLLEASLERCSRHVPSGGEPGEEPGHAGATRSLGWPGNTTPVPPDELEKVTGGRLGESGCL